MRIPFIGNGSNMTPEQILKEVLSLTMNFDIKSKTFPYLEIPPPIISGNSGKLFLTPST